VSYFKGNVKKAIHAEKMKKQGKGKREKGKGQREKGKV